jgi:Zn-dependent protease
MSASLRIGKLWGIELHLHWSLGLALVFIVWTLATDFLPSIVTDQAQAWYWIAAATAAVIFYASLVSHEMGHALVARRLGVLVDRITLWVFGGVARLRDDVGSAGAEAKIAIAGPIVSVALAIVFGAVTWALDTTNTAPMVESVTIWLAGTNLALAIFNLVPAFPLDGGRLLRALLWKTSRDRRRATSTAARVGRAGGVLMMVGGLLSLVLQDAIGGLWFVVLGWFLFSAARGEEAYSYWSGTLGAMKVGDVMRKDPGMYPGWITVDEFLRSYLPYYRMTAFPLRTFEGVLDGLVTLTRLSNVPNEMRRATRVRDVGCGLDEVGKASPSEPVSALLDRFGLCGEGQVLVLQDEQLVGMVSPADLRRAVTAAG